MDAKPSISKDFESSTGSDNIIVQIQDKEIADLSFPDINTKALTRRIDLRFFPWIGFLFFLSFLDRSSIGNAKLYGLEQDIHITDHQYLTALTIFFVTYSVFEVPSNIVLKRFRPTIWLPICVISWGICMTFQGLIHNYAGLIVIRLLLGVFEAGLFPGGVYIASSWYKRSEFGVRTAVFVTMATISGAFGGLLAAAISNMQGVGGKPAWAWIFLLEGIATVVAGFLSFWLIIDFSDTARFITEAERKFIKRKMELDGQFSVKGEKFLARYIWDSFRDYKTWICMVMAAGYNGPLYAFSLFTPSIINQLGFDANPANLLSVPIYVWAGALTCAVGYAADRVGNRGYFNLILLGIGMIGYIVLITSRNAALSYFAIYLAASGIYPVIANSSTWFANNVEGSYKRGVTLAMAFGFGNLQGAVSSNVYRARDAPRYILGHAVQLGYIAISFFATLLYLVVLKKENQKRARGERDEIILSELKGSDLQDLTERQKLNGVFETVDEARRVKGDSWSGFRYHL